MMIQIQTEGLDELIQYLEDLKIEAQLELQLAQALGGMTGTAQGATPVDTGSMQAAWYWARTGLQGLVEIDAGARNTRTGVPVTDYAGIVDSRVGIVGKVVASWSRLGFEIQL